MPNGSRASVRSPVVASWIAKANMPRNRLSAWTPHARQASSTTSVSEWVTNVAPEVRSCARSSR